MKDGSIAERYHGIKNEKIAMRKSLNRVNLFLKFLEKPGNLCFNFYVICSRAALTSN
jgi:hypothetical protein